MGFPFIMSFGGRCFYTSVCRELQIHKPNSWCQNTYPCWFVTRSSVFSRLAGKPLKPCQSKRSGVLCMEMMAGTWEKHGICGWNVCCQRRQQPCFTHCSSLFLPVFLNLQVPFIAEIQNGAIHVWCLISQLHLLWLPPPHSILTWHDSPLFFVAALLSTSLLATLLPVQKWAPRWKRTTWSMLLGLSHR